MQAVLFVGPSLPIEEVREIFSGEIRPPIRRGDFPELLNRREPPQYVGIIDGRFLHDLAVAPKEVLRALYSGVTVYGSSSMGALRAAECAPFGMVGIGRIFRMYRDEELYADDEVAISFSPETLRPISEPMVNIRIAVEAALQQHVISDQVAEKVTGVAKAMYFPDRNYRNLRIATRHDVSAEEHRSLFEFLSGPNAPDQKRLDALELIATMNAAIEGATSGTGPLEVVK